MPNAIRAKRVSNYELFFDLALVLAIGQLTSAIHIDHLTFSSILGFVLANITLLNVWNNEVFYFNKYGDSRRIDIFTVIPLMFVIGNLALTFSFEDIDGRAGVLFHVLLMVAYGIISLQYFLKGRQLGFNADIKISIQHQLVYAASLLPFTVGILPVNFWTCWIYLLPMILPLFWKHGLSKEMGNFPHSVERSQLVTILTFGESVIAIITTYPLTETLYQGALLFWGMAMMFMFYMTQTFLAIDHHSKKNGSLLFYAQVPIFLGINFFTVGLEFLADHHHAETGHLFFTIGVPAIYLGTLLTTYYNQKVYTFHRREYLFFGAMLCGLALSFWLAGPNVLLLSLLLIGFAWGMSRYYMYTRRRFREHHNIPHPDPRQNPRDFS